jgi:hypothetical protein
VIRSPASRFQFRAPEAISVIEDALSKTGVSSPQYSFYSNQLRRQSMSSTKKKIIGVVGSAVGTVLLPLIVHMISTIIAGRSKETVLAGSDAPPLESLEQEGEQQ